MTTMLYRPADEPNPEVWDLNVEYVIVEDGEIEGRLAEGWVRHPNELFPPEADAEPKRKRRAPKEG